MSSPAPVNRISTPSLPTEVVALPNLPSTPAQAESPGGGQPEDRISTFEAMDRSVHAAVARWTGGLSPAALALAFGDWRFHLATSPGKQLALAHEAIDDVLRLTEAATHWGARSQPWSLIAPAPADHRFGAPDWQLPTFNLLAQAFLLQEKWWHSATTGVRGLAKSNAAIVDFSTRQFLDTLAPSNFVPTNPEVLRSIADTGGGNLVSGLHNWFDDWKALASAESGPAPGFAVGKDVAVSKGKVVYRNELIELIQLSLIHI